MYFEVRPWKLCCPLSVSKSKVHISIYHCSNLNVQLPRWHRRHFGKQRAQRAVYHFSLNLVGLSRNTVLLHPGHSLHLTAQLHVSHLTFLLPSHPPRYASISIRENLFLALFLLCTEGSFKAEARTWVNLIIANNKLGIWYSTMLKKTWNVSSSYVWAHSGWLYRIGREEEKHRS